MRNFLFYGGLAGIIVGSLAIVIANANWADCSKPAIDFAQCNQGNLKTLFGAISQVQIGAAVAGVGTAMALISLKLNKKEAEQDKQ